MIQLKVPTKLPFSVLTYRIVTSFIFPIIVFIILNFISQQGSIKATVNNQPTTINTSTWGPLIVFGIPLLLLFLSILYNILYYNLFSFIVEAEKISITSGVLFPSTREIEFRSVQNVSTTKGPILMLCGLENVQGFTSSPGQIVVTYNKNGGSSTAYRPDINLILKSSDAEQLRNQIASASEAEAVRIIQPSIPNSTI